MKKRWIVLAVILVLLVAVLVCGYAAFKKISGAAVSEGVSGVLEAGVIVVPSEDGETTEEIKVEEYLKEDHSGEKISESFPEGTRVALPEAGVDPSTGETVSVPVAALETENQKKMEDMVSAGDRAAAIAVLARGLPADQYSYVMSLAVPPITSDKISAVAAVIRKHMSDADAAELKKIGFKYIYMLDEIVE